MARKSNHYETVGIDEVDERGQERTKKQNKTKQKAFFAVRKPVSVKSKSFPTVSV